MHYILEANNIVKRYAQHTALNDVSIAIPKGSIFGLLGPNGAGKTSLIRIINQITAPDQGRVLFAGEVLQPKHIADIGYLPEERGLYRKMKVGEQLLYLAQLKGLSSYEATKKLKYWLQKFDIQGWWDKNVEDLSKGMQQKVQFIATVIHKPKLIILDEPFSGFDPINANLLKDEILEMRENGSTIIFSTHRMESVEELCDEIVLINHAKVVLQGSKSVVKEQFKDYSYTATYTNGIIYTLPDGSEIIENNAINNHEYSLRVRLAKGTSVNELLQQLINQVTVISFYENIPSFNEIFIKVVEKGLPAT